MNGVEPHVISISIFSTNCGYISNGMTVAAAAGLIREAEAIDGEGRDV